MQHKNISRRKFIGSASCAALGTATFFSTFFNLGSINAMAASPSIGFNAPPNDYKALVCILLAGGNDSFNMLVPSSGSAYTEYSQTRTNLALAQNSLLPITPNTYNVQELGIHPAMTEVQQLFNQNKLSFISNVGTLVQPTTKTQYLNGSVSLPLGLYSHADQIQQWQTSIPHARSATGWGGRLADIMQSMNSNQNISMNVSLSGKNVFQAGNQTAEYTIKSTGTGSIGIDGFTGTSLYDQVRRTAVNSLLEQQYQDVFKQSYAEVISTANNSHQTFSAAIGQVNLSTVFSATELSQSLQMVAKTIAARENLGMSRQTFFVTFDGWDHHDEVLNAQQNMLSTVSKALNEFNAAMEELQVTNDVTTFTVSDFGRTLASNGNGTDHAWGGNVMVMGGSVNGGDVFGTYPSLALNSDLNVEDVGVLLPTLSTDEYFAELAQWYGVANSDLSTILPNIGRFYSTSSGTPPIGFMNG